MDGIIRKVNREGEFLSEYFVHKGQKVGLTRYINNTGCVAYVVLDKNGDHIECKYLDSIGQVVKSSGNERVRRALNDKLLMSELKSKKTLKAICRSKSGKKSVTFPDSTESDCSK